MGRNKRPPVCDHNSITSKEFYFTCVIWFIHFEAHKSGFEASWLQLNWRGQGVGLTKNDGTLGGNKKPALVPFDLQTNTTITTSGGVLSPFHFLPFPLGGPVCRCGAYRRGYYLILHTNCNLTYTTKQGSWVCWLAQTGFAASFGKGVQLLISGSPYAETERSRLTSPSSILATSLW